MTLFFPPSLRCFIIKSVRWCIRLQYIYVEYNIMRPKESCLEKSFGTGTQLSQCWQLQAGYASEISTEKHYKVQLILSILIYPKSLQIVFSVLKKLKSSCFISTWRKKRKRMITTSILLENFHVVKKITSLVVIHKSLTFQFHVN